MKFKVGDRVLFNKKEYTIYELSFFDNMEIATIYNGTGGTHWVETSKLELIS